MLFAGLLPPPEGGSWVESAAVTVALEVVVESRFGMLNVLKGFSKLKVSNAVSLGKALSKLARLVCASGGGVNVRLSERSENSEEASLRSVAVVVYVVVS